LLVLLGMDKVPAYLQIAACPTVMDVQTYLPETKELRREVELTNQEPQASQARSSLPEPTHLPRFFLCGGRQSSRSAWPPRVQAKSFPSSFARAKRPLKALSGRSVSISKPAVTSDTKKTHRKMILEDPATASLYLLTSCIAPRIAYYATEIDCTICRNAISCRQRRDVI